jgi:hypothetical protein
VDPGYQTSLITLLSLNISTIVEPISITTDDYLNMKISAIAISVLGLASSVSAFTTSPLFGKVPQHALRMGEGDDAVSDNPVDDFKQKQSNIRGADSTVSSINDGSTNNFVIFRIFIFYF